LSRIFSGNLMSGKSSITQLLAARAANRRLLAEDYSEPNKYLPLFMASMRKNGLAYNPYAYGTQLLFMQNRLKRERLCSDASKIYLIDRSIYEDRHTFAYVYNKLGVINDQEYNDYRNIFEKLIRTVEVPDVWVFLNTSPEKCYERVKLAGQKADDWITLELLREFDASMRFRLRERLHLHNPNLQVVEVDPNSFSSIETAADLIDQKIGQILGARWTSPTLITN
jgi:deoxyadenosine/deoxycytidine kinase